ncbi:gas vesicle protein GVPa [Trichodesmium erythraeum IMS101]|uniref:Gas vesicle protein GVPa n=1 Tax=Trichodesmium erythraeum (strain IMS101) TaxID=203124 RepID=Q112N0_TRIEI|nr:gas vesicle protein [Trichodesmium erythraeum GBRTRLIN201]
MALEKINSYSRLVKFVDPILDKEAVIDAWVRVSVVGIELLAIAISSTQIKLKLKNVVEKKYQ